MKRKVTAVEARKRLGELLEGVFYRSDEVVIERAGKTMAVVIPAHLYANIERSRRELHDMITQAQERTKDMSAEEVEALVSEAIREVREEARKREAREAKAQTK